MEFDVNVEWSVGHMYFSPDPPIKLLATVQVLPQPNAPTGTFTNHHKFLFIGITLEDTNFGDLMCR